MLYNISKVLVSLVRGKCLFVTFYNLKIGFSFSFGDHPNHSNLVSVDRPNLMEQHDVHLVSIALSVQKL